MTEQIDTRLHFIEARAGKRPALFSEAVAEGLSAIQKWMPCRFFYDEAGSHLFEMICDLPEYYLTRVERSILDHRCLEMIAAAGGMNTLVEFGSGSACKTRILLDAAAAHSGRPLSYVPIDISGEFLYNTSCSLLADYPNLSITAIAAEYTDAVALVPAGTGPRLFLFMGSNLGNFAPCEAAEFLELIRSRMRSSDRLLVGIDLFKDVPRLEAAYNDSAGITAMFNKNLLHRANRELHADFNPDLFEHTAPFVPSMSRIEMRLVSRCDQTVNIGALQTSFTFRQGEYIHTENSHKYRYDTFCSLASRAGLEAVTRWTDERDWFAVCLLKRV